MTCDTCWDYLILTASNHVQAGAYEAQIRLRRELGLLPQVRHALVVPDRGGERIGSGGATLGAIARVLEIEGESAQASPEQTLRKLRIMIVHAGGDSRRLPAYGPCGKIFMPLPGPHSGPLPLTLFDRLVPAFLELPGGAPGRGQVVVAAGDALMHWDISGLYLGHSGVIMLGCRATPEEASRHGVICLDEENSVAAYLQKPSRAQQERAGALGRSGEAVLDIGVMSMDAAAVGALLEVFDQGGDSAVQEWTTYGGLELYREICCALGSSATLDHYLAGARAGGSAWPEGKLARFYPGLREIPAHAVVLPHCRFLHFGSTRQLGPSGLAMLEHEHGVLPADSLVRVNNVISGDGSITGSDAWVEGCRISARLELAGRNVVVGADIDTPLSLPAEACLDVLAGRDRLGRSVWFTRIYGVRDSFKDSVVQGAQFCGQPMLDWMTAIQVDASQIWPRTPDPSERKLWNACVFPAGPSHGDFHGWLWMLDPGRATQAEKRAYIAADRYSAAETALLADQRAFHSRRVENRASQLVS